MVESTPARIVKIAPSFEEYHFVEVDPDKKAHLDSVVGDRPNVTVYLGDGNEILLEKILPKMTYESYRKGLLFLDPYGLDLDWTVVAAASHSRCVDVLINFPIEAMNRAVLWTDPTHVSPDQVARMDRYYGDRDTWWGAAYPSQRDLFGRLMPLWKKPGNERVVQAYRKRLKEVAGFKHVSKPMPMRNAKNAVVYYLIGASQKPQATSVFNAVFKKAQREGIGIVPTEHDRVD